MSARRSPASSRSSTVEIGDRVKQGQLLAEIDPRVLNSKVETDKSNLANLTAQLADRQAQLALARANFSRQKRLLAANATSRNDYDSALQALRSAEAQIKALQAQIAAANRSSTATRSHSATPRSTRRWTAPWSRSPPNRARR